MKHSLEKSRLFPFIAWSFVIGFTLFTWTLTLHLKAELTVLSEKVNTIEGSAKAQ